MASRETVNLVVSDSVIHNLSQALIDITNLVNRDMDIRITLNNEGPCLDTLTYRRQSKLIPILAHLCKTNNYDMQRIQIFTGNLIQDKKIWPNIKIIREQEGWFYGAHVKKIIQQKNFQYHFGNFVSNSTWPRLLLGSYLNCQHSEKTFQTYRRDPTDPGQAVDLDLDQLMFNCADPKVLDKVSRFVNHLPIEKEKNLAEHPMTLLDAGEAGEAVNGTIMSWYQNFFCDIVTETYFTGKTFFPTEKTMRPLVCGNAFLLHGPVDYLTNLKKLGFHTFSEFWDESYDKWQGYDRYKMIIKIIDDLSRLSKKQLNDLYDKMRPILIHNQQRIENLSGEDFSVFE